MYHECVRESNMADIEISGQTQNDNAHDSDIDVNGSNGFLSGYLSKWTNYIHGWQPRFIVLKDGTLSYYKRFVNEIYSIGD